MTARDIRPTEAQASRRCTVLQVDADTLTLQDDEGNQFTLPRHFAYGEIAVNDTWVLTLVDATTFDKNQKTTAKTLLTELLQED